MSWAFDGAVACRCLLGAVFAVSALSKVRNRAAWQSLRAWLADMPFGPLRWKGMPLALVTAEATVVVLVAAAPLFGLIAGAALALALTAGLYLVVRGGSREPCHCFGASSEPLSGQHVARNGTLLVLATLGAGCAGVAGATAPTAAQGALAAIGGLAAALLVIFSGDITVLFSQGADQSGATMRGAITR